MTDKDESYLTGQLLVAMPGMADPRFTRTVIYLCAHNAEGAMGLVINRLIGSITFPDLLEQLEIDN
ncbi:MAG: YqgE/AlgH family protein, partial [Kiloniellales bacterium]